ncbi:protein-disulfide reductase DsbD family protein [Curvibacter sp. APW13]|uniref:protein-disulfide reductase DsbD family protein n=1 Tax=Curvibacter sp. APW13 TaxID=3077236 RepID=UPI0028DF4F72|nr:thioredoxin family protein [Curvibacter sp. APW13]MDT8993072.1 protein-disulfide reductase DsbD family protein [Curvibacter sp. APW13]
MTTRSHPLPLPLATLWRTAVASFLIATCTHAASAQAVFGPQNASSAGPVDLTAQPPSAVVQTEQVRAELVAHAPQGLGPGKPLQLGLWLQHQPHWHTYWKNPGDSGLATNLNWTLPAGWTLGDILWPTPAKLPVGTLANYGYEGSVLLPVPVTLPKTAVKGETVKVALEASWLVCEKECVPQDGKFVLQLPVATASTAHADLFATHAQAVPQPLVGKATATPTPQGLRLEVTGLPAAWAGKALTLLPETPELLEPRTTPDSTQKTTSDEPTPTTQSWRNGSWSALVPYFSLRSATPTDIPMVLGLGTQGVSFTATVEGPWPEPAKPDATPVAHTPAATAGGSETPASLPWALAAALLGGLILNLMPCVFPVLAIKVLAFANADERARRDHHVQGLAYTAGVVGSMLALAGLMLALRAGGEQLGWGFQLQSPGVLAALALLFTLIGLNLAGVFEVGNLLPSRLAALEARHPAVDAFLSGVLAVAIASPCTAPFMGASLGYAIGLPAVQALAVFGALGLGLALPYLLASWVPQVARWLPKPGAWMAQLRHFLAFFMWGTVAWLLWVLGHITGLDGAMSLGVLLLGVALLVWALNQQGRSRTVLAIVSAALLALLAGAIGQNVTRELPQETADASGAKAGVGQWQPWSAAAAQAHLAAGHPVFIDFTAAWCITCQYNKKTTLSDPAVLADFASKDVQLLRADWTRRDPAITQALQALGRSGVPVYVLQAPGQAPQVLSEVLNSTELRAAIAKL